MPMTGEGDLHSATVDQAKEVIPPFSWQIPVQICLAGVMEKQRVVAKENDLYLLLMGALDLPLEPGQLFIEFARNVLWRINNDSVEDEKAGRTVVKDVVVGAKDLAILLDAGECRMHCICCNIMIAGNPVHRDTAVEFGRDSEDSVALSFGCRVIDHIATHHHECGPQSIRRSYGFDVSLTVPLEAFDWRTFFNAHPLLGVADDVRGIHATERSKGSQLAISHKDELEIGHK